MLYRDLSRRHGIAASAQYLELGPFKLLIDAGIDPKGIGLDATPDFSQIEDGCLDLICLTHCHLDHLGSLPVVARRHPQTPILCSRPSAMLAPRMLRNSCNVMKRQREELNISEYPLYNFAEIDWLEGQLMPTAYRHTRSFHKGEAVLDVTLYRAGHIPGAAGIELEYNRRKVFITGDVLFGEQKILPGADFPQGHVDTLIMETTRGSTPRQPGTGRQAEVQRLLQTIDNTLSQGGSALIPVFALGRMQELIAILAEALRHGHLPRVPVYCSGLGMDLVNYFDAIARKTREVRFRRQLMKDLGVRKLNHTLKPGGDLNPKGIYLLSSGMLVEHTPSYKAAAAALEHPHNTVCFVGYCDPETPGGHLQATPHDTDFLFDKLDSVVRVRASIERFDLSGHADREELLDFALAKDPRSLVLVHGDPESRDWFMDELLERAPGVQITDPEIGQSYRL